MKKPFVFLACFFASTILFLVMCMPDGPTEVTGYDLPREIALESYNVDYDGYSGKATYNLTFKAIAPVSGTLILDLYSIGKDGDTMNIAGAGQHMGGDLYTSQINVVHVDGKPVKGVLKGYFMEL
jgi:hypothetical protein